VGRATNWYWPGRKASWRLPFAFITHGYFGNIYPVLLLHRLLLPLNCLRLFQMWTLILQDSEIGEIENQKVWQLYYQNPVFGMYLVRLIIDRLLTDLRILSDRLDATKPGSAA